MGHYVELQVTRSDAAAPADAWDGSSFGLTFTRQPRFGELMLFDQSSAIEVEDYGTDSRGKLRRDLISDRASAVERFQRRLKQVRAALAWNIEACRMLEAFGQFLAAIDWPYLRFETMDYRLVRVAEEEAHFDRELDFALAALDSDA